MAPAQHGKPKQAASKQLKASQNNNQLKQPGKASAKATN
jgi:hypothetical protein